MQHTSLSTDPAQSKKLNGSVPPIGEAAALPAAIRDGQLSVIGVGILVTGNIEAEVDLQIEGRIVGDVRCATLILGERSSVSGSVFAQRVRVSGTVEGSVETVDLAIEAGAKVKGDVTYSRLRIANGGIIEGTMVHKPLTDEQLAELNRLRVVGESTAESSSAPPAKAHYFE
jgi:cytoskeletal protein CcmA (bactofilin family)